MYWSVSQSCKSSSPLWERTRPDRWRCRPGYVLEGVCYHTSTLACRLPLAARCGRDLAWHLWVRSTWSRFRVLASGLKL